MNKIIDDLTVDNSRTNQGKRFFAYGQAIKKTYRKKFRRGERKAVDYCFESNVNSEVKVTWDLF